MKIIEPSYEILTDPTSLAFALKDIEKAARTCYKSENHFDPNDHQSGMEFVQKLISRKHFAMLEHSILSVKFIVDRGVSHEMIRHRMASYAQESTRYCNYTYDKFGNEITFIKPIFFDEDSPSWIWWYEAMEFAEKQYFKLINHGATPQEARTVLPNSTKTEVIVTANFREWRHILNLRGSMDAHPQYREVVLPLHKELIRTVPVVFDWNQDE